MPDISMCDQSGCPLAAKCYRYRAMPNAKHQSYMSPEYNEEGCDSFTPVEAGDPVRSMSQLRRFAVMRKLREKEDEE